MHGAINGTKTAPNPGGGAVPLVTISGIGYRTYNVNLFFTKQYCYIHQFAVAVITHMRTYPPTPPQCTNTHGEEKTY